MSVPQKIDNVKLVMIDKHNQHYEWEKPHPTLGTSIILSGWNRAKNVNVGDVGELVYSYTGSYGLWFFTKYDQKHHLKVGAVPENLGGGYTASIIELGKYAFVGDGESKEEALTNLCISLCDFIFVSDLLKKKES